MTDDALRSLKRSFLFDGVSERAIATHSHLFVPLVQRRRTRLFEQGDPARMVYLIRKGKVKIERVTESGREVTLAIVGPEDTFGEEVVLQGALRSTTATCIDDSSLWTVRSQDFSALLARYPVAAINLAKYLMAQRDATLASIESIAYLKVPSRLLRVLERLASEYGIQSEHGTRIDVRLTHAEVASLIGSTRETVSLELSNLVRSGYLAMEGRYFLLARRQQVSVAQS